MTDSNNHWHRVYSEKSEDALSWHQAEASVSLGLIDSLQLGKDAAVIDIGGGTSRLIDGLLARNMQAVTVLDIAAVALERARDRLAPASAAVTWIAADITRWQPPHKYALWHDRAVFHFMVTAEDRTAYLSRLETGLAAGGHALIATFAPDGPETCSGLPVARYSPEMLAELLGPQFTLVASQPHRHVTPWGSGQSFQYSLLRKLPQAGA